MIKPVDTYCKCGSRWVETHNSTSTENILRWCLRKFKSADWIENKYPRIKIFCLSCGVRRDDTHDASLTGSQR